MMRLNFTRLVSVTLICLLSVNLIFAQNQRLNNQISRGGPTVTASAAPQNICQGEQSTLSASGNLGTAPYTYNWDNGIGLGDTHIVTPVTTTTYTVTITDNNSLSSTDQVTVTVFDLPVSGLYLSPTEICNGESALVDADPSGGSLPYGYNWNNGLSGSQSHTVSPSGNTNFSVTITDANGCTVEDNILLTVHDNPTVNASTTPNSICPGQTSNLSAVGAGGTPGYSYQWDNGIGLGADHTVSP
ncbi:MAG: hypothetical protein U9N51_06580, partial [Bacteroidota bacterium]|nr:hypothetical protein [Bacteroidota bacterium]